MTKTLLSLAVLSAFATATLANTAPMSSIGTTSMTIAKHGADDGNGGVDPKPHKAQLAKHGADDGNGGVDPTPHKAQLAKHGADDGNGGVDPQPHKAQLA